MKTKLEKTAKKITNIKDSIASFGEAFEFAIEGIVKASEIYVAALEDDPKNADKFKEAFAGKIPPSAWSQFEAIGRKWVHPQIVLGGIVDGKKRTAIKRLSYSTQERVFDHEKFDLVVSGGDVLKVDILDATQDQLEQICDGSGIRNVPAQRAYIESAKVKAVEVDAVAVLMKQQPDYIIRHGKLIVSKPHAFSKAQLRSLLQEM